MDTGFGIVTVKRLIRKAGAGDARVPAQIIKLMDVEAATAEAWRLCPYVE
jgi:histone H3/H4